MEETNETQPTGKLSDQLKEYIETRIKLARYQAIDKGTSFAANMITEVFVMICIGMTVFFATLTLALFLGYILKSYWIGFGIVALLYLLVAVVVSKIRARSIEPKIVNFLIKKILRTPK